MADWQERLQSLIIGFVFGYMVVKLFSVISSFRAGNLRVTRASDVDDEALLVPSEITGDEQLSAPLLATDEETEADGGDELEEDREADGDSSTSSDSEAGDDAARPREIDSTTDEPTVSGVESKDFETKKDEEVEAKKDEKDEDGVGNTESKDLITPGDNSLKALVRLLLLASSILYLHSDYLISFV